MGAKLRPVVPLMIAGNAPTPAQLDWRWLGCLLSIWGWKDGVLSARFNRLTRPTIHI